MIYYGKTERLLEEIAKAREEARDARGRAEEAQERLKRITVKARDEFGYYSGHPVSDVARAAGISRKTLYEWIKEADRYGW